MHDEYEQPKSRFDRWLNNCIFIAAVLAVMMLGGVILHYAEVLL